MAEWLKKENIRFECQPDCFKCCLKPGAIFFDADDIRRISKFLNCSPTKLKSDYLENEDGQWLINVDADNPCPFLNRQGCSIHAAKPEQCRTYPFWREILSSKKRWVSEAELCPGIGLGPMVSPETVKDRL